ncbi:hypothetical protein RJT34_27570 [Clitoria ternatea]|uniref:QWRF motif-containing protein 7 n=1 Tax=Clitoria ternatea TaxID=43366 RepID=A0AAN9FGP4_CLITE
MDKNPRSLSRRNHLSPAPPSPRLVRSRSGTTLAPAVTTTPDRSSHRFSSSERFTSFPRSKSTSRSRPHNNDGNTNTTSTNKVQEKKSMHSPSAWALSPARRFLSSPIGPEVPIVKVNGGYNSSGRSESGSGVAKVLKYFKTKKVPKVQEEEYHRFKILHNRLLQWRFINARAMVAMANVQNVAEIQLFGVWVRMVIIRKIIIEKRNEWRKVKHVMKVYLVLEGQLPFLIEWAKLERRNEESIGRLTRKLSALSNILPLTQGLKGDTDSVSEALITANKVLESIESLLTKYQTQVERVLYQVTELTTALKQEEEHLQKLLGIVPVISALLKKTGFEKEEDSDTQQCQPKRGGRHPRRLGWTTRR